MRPQGHGPVPVAIWAVLIVGSRRVVSAAIARFRSVERASPSMRVRRTCTVIRLIPSARHFRRRATAVRGAGDSLPHLVSPVGRRSAPVTRGTTAWRPASLRRETRPKARAGGSGSLGGTWRPEGTTMVRATTSLRVRQRNNCISAGMSLLGSRRATGSIMKLGKGRALVKRALGPCLGCRWPDRVRTLVPGVIPRG